MAEPSDDGSAQQPIPSTPPDGQAPPPTPRWVKVFGIIALVVLLLLVVGLLTGRGEHGPGRHMQSGGAPLPIVAATVSR